jgi:hypothetical protein
MSTAADNTKGYGHHLAAPVHYDLKLELYFASVWAGFD